MFVADAYAAAWSEDLGRTLLPRVILKRPFVFYRRAGADGRRKLRTASLFSLSPSRRRGAIVERLDARKWILAFAQGCPGK